MRKLVRCIETRKMEFLTVGGTYVVEVCQIFKDKYEITTKKGMLTKRYLLPKEMFEEVVAK